MHRRVNCMFVGQDSQFIQTPRFPSFFLAKMSAAELYKTKVHMATLNYICLLLVSTKLYKSLESCIEIYFSSPLLYAFYSIITSHPVKSVSFNYVKHAKVVAMVTACGLTPLTSILGNWDNPNKHTIAINA